MTKIWPSPLPQFKRVLIVSFSCRLAKMRICANRTDIPSGDDKKLSLGPISLLFFKCLCHSTLISNMDSSIFVLETSEFLSMPMRKNVIKIITAEHILLHIKSFMLILIFCCSSLIAFLFCIFFFLKSKKPANFEK